MTADINKTVEIVTPFDDFEHEGLLNEIQGNIIKPHGRNHAVYLFLKFGDDIEAAKQWIGNFSQRYVTSALEQAKHGKLHRLGKDLRGALFTNFFLTRAGYMHLGYSYGDLPNDDAFRQGMQDYNMQQELGDDVNQWESGFKEEIHALVLFAADRIAGSETKKLKDLEQQEKQRLIKLPALLRNKVAAIETDLSGIASVVQYEIGYVLRNEDREEIEHFGFRDGVSQPLFLGRDIDKEREHSDFSQWDPRAPLSLVLFKDPNGSEQESYGSFFVFRKLEQDVPGWNNDVKNNLAQKLDVEPDLAGAYTMGRFPDGTPVVRSNKTSDEISKDNNFNYQEDSQGVKCPFHAHIRKVNPRGDTGNQSLVATPTDLEEEKMHRIVRRGISYGDLPEDNPTEGAGLLFGCFQADLTRQFNFMQKAWANERNFVKRDVGADVVIGVEKKENNQSVAETYNWSTNWGEEGETEADFTHWVTMKGGEFFFAPSMSFLRSLAPEPSRNIEFRGVPSEEIKAARNTIAELENYKKQNWAIGLNGDTLEPDGFLTFFNQRELPFKFYLLNQARLGDSSAYDENIATLKKYIKDIIQQEIDACEYKSAELEEYENLVWAIGLNGDNLEPDGFLSFFGERKLPFKFFVQSQGVSLGNNCAYDENIKTLNEYIKKLSDYICA